MTEEFKEMVKLYNEISDRFIEIEKLRLTNVYQTSYVVNEFANLLQEELKRVKAKRNESN